MPCDKGGSMKGKHKGSMRMPYGKKSMGKR